MNPISSMPELVRMFLRFLFGRFTSPQPTPVRTETSRQRRERNARRREIRALHKRRSHGRQTGLSRAGTHRQR
jgi:hypothetical protein